MMKEIYPEEPLISIVTVTYNAALVLQETLDSIFSQDYKNVECIVIDGGSKDGTVDLLKKNKQKITRWISEPDDGIYDAMNKGVNMAKGEWVYFLGAGDTLNNVLHKMVSLFSNKNTIYYGDVYRKDTNSIYNGKFSSFQLAVNNICHQAIIYPSNVFDKYNYNGKYKVFADHILNMQLHGDKKYTFKYLPVIISNYEGDGFSVKSNDKFYVQDKIKIIRSNFSVTVFLYALTRRSFAQLIKLLGIHNNNNQK